MNWNELNELDRAIEVTETSLEYDKSMTDNPETPKQYDLTIAAAKAWAAEKRAERERNSSWQ